MSDGDSWVQSNWVQTNPDWIQTAERQYPQSFDPLNLYHSDWELGKRKTPTFDEWGRLE